MSKSQKKSGKDVNDNLVDTTAQSPGNDTDSDGGEGVVRALEEAAAGELPNHDAGGNVSGVQYTAAERDELRAELLKTEEEIATLRNVLESRVRHCAELKRKLGVTPWHEISSDINSGVNYIKQSDAFHMTEEAIKKVNDKSRSLYSTVTQKVSDQVGTVKRMIITSHWKIWLEACTRPSNQRLLHRLSMVGHPKMMMLLLLSQRPPTRQRQRPNKNVS